MNKRLLSMFLALCMIVSMLPVSAMAEEIYTTIGGSGEIISFAPLTETAKAASLGTSIEDLELPETLTATVRTAVPADENSTQDSGSPETATPTTATEPKWAESTVEIPVRWASPDYDMNTEGVYVFTPVIENYTISAPLPELTVTVGEMLPTAAARGMVTPMSITDYGIWVGGVQVTSENASNVLGDGGTVTYDPDSSTLTLNGADITGYYTKSIFDFGIFQSSDSIVSNLTIHLIGTNRIAPSGSSFRVCGIYSEKAGGSLTFSAAENGELTILGNAQGQMIYCTGPIIIGGGTISATGGNGICSSAASVTINGGNVTANSNSADAFGSGIVCGVSLYITAGTVTASSLNGYGVNVYDAPTVTGGTLTATGGKSAIVFYDGSLSASDGMRIMASTNIDGGDAVAYDAANLATYKYIKVEPAAGGAITEQFNLTPGGTYYFDLSGEKDNIGTVNSALPDTTLHYVPFTYAGTVNAYSLPSEMETTEEYAAANKSDRSLFVGDYNIGTSVNWDSLNTAHLIFGKTFDTNYKLRSLSAGGSRTGSASDGSDHVGQPSTNEWDQILDKSGSTDNTTGWIKNWHHNYTWAQDFRSENTSYRAIRGADSARRWDYATPWDARPAWYGFRPALEVLSPVALTSDGLKVVTLSLNGGKLKDSTANISIICAGGSFKAPSGEGLTAPIGKAFAGWKDTSSTITYAAGATVPNTVTGLTAQWAAPTAVTSVSVPANGTYSAGSNLDFTVNFDEDVTVTGTPYISLIVGSQTKLATYVSGSGTTALVFRYMISAGDSDSDGVTVVSLTLNGGTIQDAAGNNVILTLYSIGNTSGVLVNTANASLSPTSATFDLNPNSANYKDIDVTLTQGGYYLSQIKNGGVPLLSISDYIPNGGGSYTLKKSYLSSLGVGSTTITFIMNGGTSPTLALTIEDTRIELTSVAIDNTAPKFGDTLSATIEPSAATITYSWKADGSPVGIGATYEVKAADIGKAITLTVTGTGTYKGAVTSPATSAVVARDYSVTVDSSKSVAQGLGVSSLPTADAGSVTGTLTWYSNSGRTIAAVDTDISALSVGGSVTLYWSFTATTTGYVTTPKTGECVVTIVSGAAQTLSFAQSTVTKTVGDPIFTNVLTHSVGTGAVTYSSSNTGVATVHPTTGVVAIVGAGTTTITANAAMVPGEYAPGSASFTLTVNAPAKSVSVGPQIGTATAGTAGSLTYTVTTANIADGTYAVSVANLPAGVTIGNSGNVTISGNSGTLTLTVADSVAAGTTGTLALTLDGATSAAFSIVIGEPAPATTHTVTFNPNGGTVSETSRSVAPGTAVGALPTPTRSGSYSFDGWYTAASGGTQISAGTTVSANVTYYAHWTYTGGGGSGSGGGSSSNDNSSPVIVTPPAPDKPNSPTQGEIKVPGTVDGKGNVTVSITDKTVTDAFNKALAEAKKNGTEQNGITVVLRVDTGNKAGSNVTVNLPKAVQDTIIAKKIVNTIVVVDNPDIRVGMDLATVQEINKQAKSDVNITATRTNSGKLTGEAKKAIGSRPVFDLKVNYGSGKAVSSFGAGSVSVTIPYTLGANEKAGNVQAVYVDSKGKVHWLVNSVYDSVEKVLRFSTDHFSTYGIGYKQANTAFTDIAGHWAKEDIEFVASRGLFSGTSETKFSPNTAMTRGMFVTALGRLANADVSGYAKSSFSDVKDDAYYMSYIEWASKNNIVNGVGNGKFAPDQSITREQMAVIMSNYSKTIGYTLPKVHIENIFTDNAKISIYAKEAVKQMQMAGVISGKNGNLYDPQGTATRAEVSAVLRRFVELAISSDTAQGWSMNDSGKWMYFKDGKPLTGKQDIDGATYTFDQYGVTADVPKNLRYTTYTVQKGDSFWSISRKLGCPMSELERLNNKSRFSLILPGEVLRVPEK